MSEKHVCRNGRFTAALLFGIWVSGTGPMYEALRLTGESKAVAFLGAQLWPFWVSSAAAEWIKSHPRAKQ